MLLSCIKLNIQNLFKYAANTVNIYQDVMIYKITRKSKLTFNHYFSLVLLISSRILLIPLRVAKNLL